MERILLAGKLNLYIPYLNLSALQCAMHCATKKGRIEKQMDPLSFQNSQFYREKTELSRNAL